MKLEKELKNTDFYRLVNGLLVREVLYDTPGNYQYTPRIGVKSLLAVVVGSGGGSGRAFVNVGASNTSASGGGGGPGQACFLMEKTDSTPINIIIGAGGAGGTSGGGQQGGTTQFDNFIIAGGFGSPQALNNTDGTGIMGGQVGDVFPNGTKWVLVSYEGGKGGSGDRANTVGGAGGRILYDSIKNSYTEKEDERITNSILISGYPSLKGGDGVYVKGVLGLATQVSGKPGSDGLVLIYEYRDGLL